MSTPISPIFGQLDETISKIQLWNREELYEQVWKAPIGTIALQYGVSRRVLVQVCEKLKIPRPELGKWRRIELGMHVRQIPLPPARDLPFVPKLKRLCAICPAQVGRDLFLMQGGPTVDAIRRVEGTPRFAQEETRTHHLVRSARSILFKAKQRDCGSILRSPCSCECVDVRVSRETLDRALQIVNAILLLLEDEGFSIKITGEVRQTVACIFGQQVPFYLREKLRLEWRRRKKDPDRREFRYKPTQVLEFRCGFGYCTSFSLSDGARSDLGHAVHICVAALMREARFLQSVAEREAKLEADRQREHKRLEKLSRLVAKEESKVHDLEDSVSNWREAQQIRRFLAALRTRHSKKAMKSFVQQANESHLKWIRQQADRLDPFRPSPPSILDRRSELASNSTQPFWPMLFEQAIFNPGLMSQIWQPSESRRLSWRK